jgi:hypothetical protein
MLKLQILKNYIGPIFFILLSTGFLYAGEVKGLPLTSPDTLQDCDQDKSETTAPDLSINSPLPSSKKRAENPNPLPPPDIENQQGTRSKV